MPRKSISEPVFDKGRDRWRVTVSASMSQDGKRVRSWHATRDAARAYVAGLTGGKEPAAVIPPALAMKADEARAILEPWKLDIVQAAREVANALEILGGAGSITQAAKAFRATHDARSSSNPLGVSIQLYLACRADLRDATLKSYSYTLEKVLAPLHDHMMADIQTTDLEAILKEKRATARAMHHRNLRAFWKWAAKPPRGWCQKEVLEALEAPRVSSDSDISILSPSDVRALLKAAEAEGPAAAVAYAIAVFGGVRMAELEKLAWGDVSDEHIEIGKDVAKKHSRRLVPVCPSLKAWLDANRGEAEDDTPIVPPNWVDISKSVRRRAGWDVAARLLTAVVKAGKLKEMPKITRGAWPANACRHTCASVQVAIGTPLEDLTFKFGHSGGHDLLRRHYVSRLTKKDAVAILSIGPNGEKVPNLNVA